MGLELSEFELVHTLLMKNQRGDKLR